MAAGDMGRSAQHTYQFFYNLRFKLITEFRLSAYDMTSFLPAHWGLSCQTLFHILSS